MEPSGMNDQPENLMLVFLRRLDTKMDRLADDVREVRERLASVALGLAGVRLDIGGLPSRTRACGRGLIGSTGVWSGSRSVWT